MNRLLIFLNDDGDHWLRLVGPEVVGRGPGLPVPMTDEAVIAVVPGDAVALHWVALPPLAPAQAAAAARILAADVSAVPPELTHVAIGAPGASDQRPLGIVATAAMIGWLARLGEEGIVPEYMVPAPLLLPEPVDGVIVATHHGLWLARGPGLALGAEPGLAAMMLGDAAVTEIDAATFEAGLAPALAAAPLNLRQGAFAVARQWRVEPRRWRRLAVLVAALLAAVVVTDLTALFRYSLEADRAERALADAARAALPRGAVVTSPRADVAARLAALGGGGGGFAALAGPLVSAVRDRPSVTLRSLAYAPATGLAATVAARSASDRDAVVAAVNAAGLIATVSAPREQGGQLLADVTVRAR